MDELSGVLGAQNNFDAKAVITEIASDFNLLGRLLYKIYSQHRRHRHLRYLLAVHRLVRKLLTKGETWTVANMDKAIDEGRRAGEALRQYCAMGHWLPFCLTCLGVLARWYKHFLPLSSRGKDDKSQNAQANLNRIRAVLGVKGGVALNLISDAAAGGSMPSDLGQAISRDEL